MKNKELAIFMHNTYEKIAKKKNWETQKKTRVPFSKLPKENKETMLEVAKQVILWFKKQGCLGFDDFTNKICIDRELFEEKCVKEGTEVKE